MNDAVLAVRFAGPNILVQDGGRPGFLRYGVPCSGPMDRTAFAAANIALGNRADASAIEVSLGGLVLECVAGTVSFAVAGGAFTVDHGDRHGCSWIIATLACGERLTIRSGPSGSWCYLALAGQLQSERWLGSASTHAMSGLGGGRLEAGQHLRITGASLREDREGAIARPTVAGAGSFMRVTVGPQHRFFSADTLATFLAGPWRTTAAADRMGTRLSGPAIAPKATLDMPSEPIVRGSVQVAGDGVATVLLADHQTTGGYPKIATILDCDLDAFVQRQPGDPIVFGVVDPSEAIRISRAAAGQLATYQSAIATARGLTAHRLMTENLISGMVDAVGPSRSS